MTTCTWQTRPHLTDRSCYFPGYCTANHAPVQHMIDGEKRQTGRARGRCACPDVVRVPGQHSLHSRHKAWPPGGEQTRRHKLAGTVNLGSQLRRHRPSPAFAVEKAAQSRSGPSRAGAGKPGRPQARASRLWTSAPLPALAPAPPVPHLDRDAGIVELPRKVRFQERGQPAREPGAGWDARCSLARQDRYVGRDLHGPIAPALIKAAVKRKARVCIHVSL